MQSLNMKRTVLGTLTEVAERVTAAIKIEGFGVVSRIDFHEKFK